ncbi:MAG TPA: adenylate kinase [Opitutaceae bacterium]|nr:adenylate kinase [Opitutaceae bacterium]
MAGISDPFAGFGPAAKAKFVLLGPSTGLVDRIRSLNLEHVSPAQLTGPGISREARTTSSGRLHAAISAAEEATMLARMRRWFFARKPDAGFVLTDFPATLLQAKVLDEWLDARDETLNGVIVVPGYTGDAILEHYKTLGLLMEAGDLAA